MFTTNLRILTPRRSDNLVEYCARGVLGPRLFGPIDSSPPFYTALVPRLLVKLCDRRGGFAGKQPDLLLCCVSRVGLSQQKQLEFSLGCRSS